MPNRPIVPKAVMPRVPQAFVPPPARHRPPTGPVQRKGVIQRAAESKDEAVDDAFTLVAKKPKPTAGEREAKKAGAKDQRFLDAEKALMAFKPTRAASTICVFLDHAGGVIAYGESGWDKSGMGADIGKVLTTHMVKHKSQATGYGGVQCAEPEAAIKAYKTKKLTNAQYSLAWDQQSDSYKEACPSCKLLLKTYNITDLCA